ERIAISYISALAIGLSFTLAASAQGARCGGLNQQACKANEGPRACTGRLVDRGGRCRVRKPVPRNIQPRKVEPHVQIEKPPPIRPQLCDPSALKTKGGRC